MTRLRWYGVLWCRPERMADAWLYWRISHKTIWRLWVDNAFDNDTCLEVQPR